MSSSRMLARLRPRLTYANVAATVAVVLALGGGAFAATGLVDSERRIHACVGSDGVPHIVQRGTRCGNGRTPLAWNGLGAAHTKQFEFNSIKTDGRTYPMLGAVAGVEVKARCTASDLHVIVDTSGGKPLHFSGFVENDNATLSDNPVGAVVPPADFSATAYGGFQGIAESDRFSKWVGLSIWGGHYSDHCRFWGTVTPP